MVRGALLRQLFPAAHIHLQGLGDTDGAVGAEVVFQEGDTVLVVALHEDYDAVQALFGSDEEEKSES